MHFIEIEVWTKYYFGERISSSHGRINWTRDEVPTNTKQYHVHPMERRDDPENAICQERWNNLILTKSKFLMVSLRHGNLTFASFGSTNNNITMINNNNNNKCKCPEDVTSMLRNYIDRKLFQSFSKKLRKSWNLFLG